MEIKEATETIVMRLKHDQFYYLGWQTSLSIAFYNQLYRTDSLHTKFPEGLSEGCDKAAKRFLDTFIGDHDIDLNQGGETN